MALINCPECKKEISDKAIACPNCGCPIAVTNTYKNTANNKTEVVVMSRNWISLIAVIVLVLGFNLSFFRTNEKANAIIDISSGKIGEWVSNLKRINEVDRGIGFITEAVGEKQRTSTVSFDTAVTVGTITLAFLVIAMIVLIVNYFKPLKTGPILVGVVGIVLLIILTSSISSPLKEKYGVQGNADVGCFVLGIGLFIGIFADFDLQKKLGIARGKDERTIQNRPPKIRMISPEKAISNDLTNAAFLMNEVEYLINENKIDINAELPSVFGKNVPLIAVYPNGSVESKTNNVMKLLVDLVMDSIKDKEELISINYRVEGADHWVIGMNRQPGKDWIYIVICNEDESREWMLRPCAVPPYGSV